MWLVFLNIYQCWKLKEETKRKEIEKRKTSYLLVIPYLTVCFCLGENPCTQTSMTHFKHNQPYFNWKNIDCSGASSLKKRRLLQSIFQPLSQHKRLPKQSKLPASATSLTVIVRLVFEVRRASVACRIDTFPPSLFVCFVEQVARLSAEEWACYCACYADECGRGVTAASLSICVSADENILVWADAFVAARWPVNHVAERAGVCGHAARLDLMPVCDRC